MRMNVTATGRPPCRRRPWPAAPGSSCQSQVSALAAQHRAARRQDWFPASSPKGSLVKGKHYEALGADAVAAHADGMQAKDIATQATGGASDPVAAGIVFPPALSYYMQAILDLPAMDISGMESAE